MRLYLIRYAVWALVIMAIVPDKARATAYALFLALLLALALVVVWALTALARWISR